MNSPDRNRVSKVPFFHRKEFLSQYSEAEGQPVNLIPNTSVYMPA